MPLNVRQTGDRLTIVGLREHTPSTYAAALELLNRGCLERTTKSTKMNSASSRSHAIFTVVLHQARGASVVESQMAFVDLAGSERLKRTECRGSAARESISINTGLLSLGNVSNALYLKKGHVLFRDSKLTRILARCLSSHLLLLACVSAEAADTFETANTLKYASRAALISQEERVHITTDRDKLIIDQLKREISRLKDENTRLRGMLTQRSRESAESVKAHPYVLELLKKIDALGRRGSAASDRQAVGGAVDEECQQHADAGGLSPDAGAAASNPARHLSRGRPAEAAADRAPARTANTDMRLRNTMYNKNIQAAEIECASTGRRERLVYFDLEPKSSPSSAEPSRNIKSLYTPKKERLSVFPVLQGTVGYAAVAMAALRGSLVASCSDGVVRELADREVPLFSDSAVRCLATASGTELMPGNAVFYSCRSLLKIYDGSAKPMPVHAYKSEISSLRVAGNFIYTGHEDGSFAVLDLRGPSLVFSDQLHRSTVFDIEEIDGRIFTCSRDHSIKCTEGRAILDGTYTPNTSPVLTPPHYDTVTRLLSYKSVLVSLSRDCSVKTWRDTRPYKTVPYAHDSWIRAGAVLPNCWATGCKGGLVRCVGRVDAKAPVVCMAACSETVWVGCQKDIQMYKIGNKAP